MGLFDGKEKAEDKVEEKAEVTHHHNVPITSEEPKKAVLDAKEEVKVADDKIATATTEEALQDAPVQSSGVDNAGVKEKDVAMKPNASVAPSESIPKKADLKATKSVKVKFLLSKKFVHAGITYNHRKGDVVLVPVSLRDILVHNGSAQIVI